MNTQPTQSRRDFLFQSYLGLGGIALIDLLAQDIAADTSATNPLTPKPPHFLGKAKRCIFLFMEGGVSQMDTFDYKPELQRLHGKTVLLEFITKEEGEYSKFNFR